MPASFKSLPLFASGPHRFLLGEKRNILVPLLSQGILEPGSIPIGLDELRVLVRGRLVAASESALWTLRDAMAAEITHPLVPGTLVDRSGHTWTDMSFARFTEEERTDRGRTWSMAYECEFRKLLL